MSNNAINLLKNAITLLAGEPYSANNAIALNDVRQALLAISSKEALLAINAAPIAGKKAEKTGSVKVKGRPGRKPKAAKVAPDSANSEGETSTADIGNLAAAAAAATPIAPKRRGRKPGFKKT